MNSHNVPALTPAVLLPVARWEPERSESDRSTTGSKTGPEPSAHPDPEVLAQAKRRTFTAGRAIPEGSGSTRQPREAGLRLRLPVNLCRW